VGRGQGSGISLPATPGAREHVRARGSRSGGVAAGVWRRGSRRPPCVPALEQPEHVGGRAPTDAAGAETGGGAGRPGGVCAAEQAREGAARTARPYACRTDRTRGQRDRREAVVDRGSPAGGGAAARWRGLLRSDAGSARGRGHAVRAYRVDGWRSGVAARCDRQRQNGGVPAGSRACRGRRPGCVASRAGDRPDAPTGAARPRSPRRPGGRSRRRRSAVRGVQPDRERGVDRGRRGTGFSLQAGRAAALSRARGGAVARTTRAGGDRTGVSDARGGKLRRWPGG